MKYDVIKYWNEREDPNNPSNPLHDHSTYVYKNLEECKSILDFGPGIGRMFPAFADCDDVIGYDISFKYVERIHYEASLYPFEFTLMIENEISELPFKDGQFDAVVCVSVLLHQTKDKIESIMSELCRVGKKVIVISFYNPKKEIKEGDTYFHYDYPEICERNGWNIIEMEIRKRQIYFVYSR